MWYWIFIISIPFILLLFIEEIGLAIVHRYVNGPAKLEVKIKGFLKKCVEKVKIKNRESV